MHGGKHVVSLKGKKTKSSEGNEEKDIPIIEGGEITSEPDTDYVVRLSKI